MLGKHNGRSHLQLNIYFEAKVIRSLESFLRRKRYRILF
jgi:hypothetical protein